MRSLYYMSFQISIWFKIYSKESQISVTYFQLVSLHGTALLH